jgi:hypothetical protein
MAGLLGIDNNAAERALRAVAIGRKNYRSCCPTSGRAQRGAVEAMSMDITDQVAAPASGPAGWEPRPFS